MHILASRLCRGQWAKLRGAHSRVGSLEGHQTPGAIHGEQAMLHACSVAGRACRLPGGALAPAGLQALLQRQGQRRRGNALCQQRCQVHAHVWCGCGKAKGPGRMYPPCPHLQHLHAHAARWVGHAQEPAASCCTQAGRWRGASACKSGQQALLGASASIERSRSCRTALFADPAVGCSSVSGSARASELSASAPARHADSCWSTSRSATPGTQTSGEICPAHLCRCATRRRLLL